MCFFFSSRTFPSTPDHQFSLATTSPVRFSLSKVIVRDECSGDNDEEEFATTSNCVIRALPRSIRPSFDGLRR